ncbi:hypothetical protein BN946_scf184743.g3 [Trametes cinnabarina]|uniref:Uncharacterized protein n=1 Tax=Pycnoporus cinnabarinus TaxID=5643 RepID=A0A060ST44_PYCCI|nr:hypothetical protein BN946_scf184743.g3 [Trametes cinnabarina]
MSSHRSRRRNLTREQLLQGLQILGPISAPLPPELPPSPPASRDSSPAPGHKRRHQPDSDDSRNKKPRVADVSSLSRPRSAPQVRLSSTAPTASSSSSRHEPSEDGEVKEESPSGSSFMPSGFSFMPVRRPRRGDNIPTSEWDAVYEKCFKKARMLRFSALARVAAAHSSTSKEYRPLRNPPNPNSSYAKHSLLMARLELIDSALHFVYGLWCKDYSVRTCYRAAWRTVDEFLKPTKKKLIAESNDEREKAFIGLLHMVDAHIHGRKLKYQAAAINIENDQKINRLYIQWKAEKAQQARAAAAAQNTPSGATPNMLPSPASSNSANSSNSTPLGGHGTPGHSVAADIDLQLDVPHRPGEPERQLPPPPAHIHIPVNTQFIYDRKSQCSGLLLSSHYMQTAQQTLNLPIMARYYPRTLARMMYTTLGPQDEHEPDFQDDDGELFWPSQAITGEGLGWVCLMGMAMVKEFGKEYGYQGVDGVVPRVNGEDMHGFPEPRFVPHTR